MAYMGLDVGTSGVKATVVDEGGASLFSASREYDLSFPKPGWVELHPEVVWAAAAEAIRAVCAAYGQPIQALSIASFGEAAAMLDDSDRPIGPSIFFTDVRGSEQVQRVCEILGRESLEGRTGMPVNFMYTLMKLIWLHENQPERFSRIRKLLPFGAYVAYRLTDEAAVDYSLASRMLLFNRQEAAWDREVLDAFSIDENWLPRLVPAGRPVGAVRPAVAESLGLSEDTLVVSGVHDQIAAALGAGVVQPGDAADGIGSSECITAMIGEGIDYKGLHRQSICAEPYAMDDRFVALIFNNTSGSALKWYKNTFEEELMKRADREGKSVYELLNDRMASSPSPLLFLPHLAGAGTPTMDSAATGLISGLTLSTTRADVYRAILEGMNFEMRLNLQILTDCGLEIPLLTAVGGGSVSERVLKIKASILDRPIRTVENPHSGTVGLAILCAVALGRYTSIPEAVSAIVRERAIIEPNPEWRTIYQQKYEQYSRLYPAGKMIYNR